MITGYFYVDVSPYSKEMHDFLVNNGAIEYNGYTSSLSVKATMPRLYFPGTKPTHFGPSGARIFFSDLPLTSWFLLQFEDQVTSSNAQRRMKQEELGHK